MQSGLRCILLQWACALALALALAGGNGRGVQALRCESQLTSCSCVTNSEYGGQVVDFSKLNSRSIVIPRFSARMTEAPYWTFEYNPCGPFYCTDRAAAARYEYWIHELLYKKLLDSRRPIV